MAAAAAAEENEERERERERERMGMARTSIVDRRFALAQNGIRYMANETKDPRGSAARALCSARSKQENYMFSCFEDITDIC